MKKKHSLTNFRKFSAGNFRTHNPSTVSVHGMHAIASYMMNNNPQCKRLAIYRLSDQQFRAHDTAVDSAADVKD